MAFIHLFSLPIPSPSPLLRVAKILLLLKSHFKGYLLEALRVDIDIVSAHPWGSLYPAKG